MDDIEAIIERIPDPRAVQELIAASRDMQCDISSLRFELKCLEHIRVRDNAYLIDQRDAARRKLAEARAAVHGLTQDGLELQRELAEAQRDAARYRWMRGNGAITDRRAPGHLFNYGIGLDAAIDAAMPTHSPSEVPHD